MEYRVKFIHPDPPKEWNNPKGGTVYYLTVDLEGISKPVSIGKKDPKALKEGDTVYGDIIPTEFLEDKFKPSPKPEFAQKSGGQQDRGNGAQKSMCVKLAFDKFVMVESFLPSKPEHWAMIKETANHLNAIINDVPDKGEVKEHLPTPPKDLDIEKEYDEAIDRVNEVFNED
jgi:hypothetical protein